MNELILEKIQEISKTRKKSMMGDLTPLSKGIWGKTYTGELRCFPGHTVVVKKLVNGTFANNEYEALIYLRDKMLKKEIPPYYNFIYGNYSKDGYRYFILEKADKMLDDVMIDTLQTTEWYKDIFMQLFDAVDYLEKLKINHGDLWNDNLMVRWGSGESESPKLVLIDWDSAFGENTAFQNPTLGGGTIKKKRFILGYDLNRYFDAILYSYNSYQRKKNACIKRFARKVSNPEEHPEVLEYDNENVVHPKEILSFLKTIEKIITHIDKVDNDTDLSKLSAVNMRKLLEVSLAETLAPVGTVEVKPAS